MTNNDPLRDELDFGWDGNTFVTMKPLERNVAKERFHVRCSIHEIELADRHAAPYVRGIVRDGRRKIEDHLLKENVECRKCKFLDFDFEVSKNPRDFTTDVVVRAKCSKLPAIRECLGPVIRDDRLDAERYASAYETVRTEYLPKPNPDKPKTESDDSW